LLAKIDREIENKKQNKPAFIRLKLNSLLDEQFVEALYLASMAGVEVDLVVRGICAIRPGIEGLSENIRVKSILGRFLEHSRIFHFANGGDDEIYIGSADLMDRNLNRRVESLVQIVDSNHKQELIRIFNQYLDPQITSWFLKPDGTWQRVSQTSEGEPLTDLHTLMINAYKEQV
jgi:polyphosphate kinase